MVGGVEDWSDEDMGGLEGGETIPLNIPDKVGEGCSSDSCQSSAGTLWPGLRSVITQDIILPLLHSATACQ